MECRFERGVCSMDSEISIILFSIQILSDITDFYLVLLAHFRAHGFDEPKSHGLLGVFTRVLNANSLDLVSRPPFVGKTYEILRSRRKRNSRNRATSSDAVDETDTIPLY